MHQLTDWLTKVVMRRVAPARADQMLDDEQMAKLATRMKRANAVAVPVGIAAAAAVGITLTLVLNRIDLAAHVPPDEPVFLERNGMTWLAVGLPIGMAVGLAPAAVMVRWRMGRDAALVSRYEATRTGVDPTRSAALVAGLFTAGGLFFAAYAWQQGTVIDRTGIRFKPGLTAYERGYHDVVEIVLYDKLTAPIGVLDEPNIEVTFTTEPPYRLRADKRRGPAELDAIAAFISKRAGIPVERQPVRP